MNRRKFFTQAAAVVGVVAIPFSGRAEASDPTPKSVYVELEFPCGHVQIFESPGPSDPRGWMRADTPRSPDGKYRRSDVAHKCIYCMLADRAEAR